MSSPKTIDKSLFSEKGITGVPDWDEDSSDRYLDRLRGAAGIEQMARLLRKEPSAFTLNHAIMMTAQESTWRVVPADNSPASKRQAELLEQSMDDMSQDWWVSIQFALSGVALGFADLEHVFKRRLGRTPPGSLPPSKYNDGRVGLRKLAIRRQETVIKWNKDETGDAKFMVQRDPETGKELEPIPIAQLLHFNFGADRGSWEGIGWLEPAYKLAQYIENLEIIYGIGMQRSFVGVPTFAYAQKPDADTKAIVTSMLKNLVVNEQAYITYPKDAGDLSLLTVDNPNGGEVRAMIGQLRWELMALALATFIRLGSTETGAKALADPLINLFRNSVDSALNQVGARVLNRHLVPRIMAANPSLAAGVIDYPQFQPSSIRQPPSYVLEFLGAIQSFLLSAGAEDERWMRGLLHMPDVLTSQQEGAEEPEEEPGQDEDEDTDEETTTDDEGGNEEAARTETDEDEEDTPARKRELAAVQRAIIEHQSASRWLGQIVRSSNGHA